MNRKRNCPLIQTISLCKGGFERCSFQEFKLHVVKFDFFPSIWKKGSRHILIAMGIYQSFSSYSLQMKRCDRLSSQVTRALRILVVRNAFLTALRYLSVILPTATDAQVCLEIVIRDASFNFPEN